MLESISASALLIFASVIVVVCYLVYVSRGNRPVKMYIKALGIEVNIDAASAPHVRREGDAT